MALITEYGAFPDGTDAAPSISATIASNSLIEIPYGKFSISSGAVIDNSTMPGDTEIGPCGKIIKGQDARQSLLHAMNSLSGNLVSLKYGLGGASHADHRIEKFSLIGNNASNGLVISNSAYLRVSDITLRGHKTAMYLESVLSSSFRDMRIDNNEMGVLAYKGPGFSNINAVRFDAVTISDCSKIGYAGAGAHHGFNFKSGTVEHCGTQGDLSSGGIFLNFDGGAEGAVGAIIEGAYFEGNRGAADIRLENLGARRVTVVITGNSFTRLSNAQFVQNNILAIGNINLVLIGNGFMGTGDYVPSASRPCWTV